METLLEISQLLLSDFLRIQVCMILQKATKPFITLSLQWDQLQLLPSAETWVIQHMPGLYPEETPDPSCSPSLVAPASCCFTAGSRTPPRALLQHPHQVLENDTAIDLLSLSVAKCLAYMDTSSPFPAATASLAALTKLLGNFNDCL